MNRILRALATGVVALCVGTSFGQTIKATNVDFGTGDKFRAYSGNGAPPSSCAFLVKYTQKDATAGKNIWECVNGTMVQQGTSGTPGSAATIAVGTVTTGAAGSSASVTNVGTSSAAVFNITIPKGDTGSPGSGEGSSDPDCGPDGSGNSTCKSYGSTGTTQGIDALGVGTGNVDMSKAPSLFAGWIGPQSGTPTYFAVLPNVNPTAAGDMVLGAAALVNGVNQAPVTTVPHVSNVTVTLPTTLIAANTCTTPATVTDAGLTTTSVPVPSFASDPSAVAGWGANGGLTFNAWPTAGTLNWEVCNQSGADITPGAMTLNVGAK